MPNSAEEINGQLFKPTVCFQTSQSWWTVLEYTLWNSINDTITAGGRGRGTKNIIPFIVITPRRLWYWNGVGHTSYDRLHGSILVECWKPEKRKHSSTKDTELRGQSAALKKRKIWSFSSWYSLWKTFNHVNINVCRHPPPSPHTQRKHLLSEFPNLHLKQSSVRLQNKMLRIFLTLVI